MYVDIFYIGIRYFLKSWWMPFSADLKWRGVLFESGHADRSDNYFFRLSKTNFCVHICSSVLWCPL
jgi:hypothetical protein